jgi:hypothetical protein
MGGDGEIDIDRVAYFDAKAFDTGVDDKAIALLDTKLSAKAKQFVEHQSIKVLELGKTKKLDIVPPDKTDGNKKEISSTPGSNSCVKPLNRKRSS